jgi:2-methylcitrate dehydratase PrpD
MSATQQTPNAAAAGRFIAAATQQNFPAEVVDAARMCLVDTVGVALGARDEPAGQVARKVAGNWGSRGDAQILLGGKAAPAAAALVNATMGHCLDYDDTHVGAVAHLSNPTWNATLAMGLHHGASERAMLAAFIAGFETGARLGNNGLGQVVNLHGFHSTGVFGCLAAATAASVLLGLDETGVRNALGAAATQVGGLVASFGTMAKPFHAGKAALNGILAAELAAEGFTAAQDMLEPDGPLAAALVQDKEMGLQVFDPADPWELPRNTFKPYSCCLLTHPVVDSARAVADRIKGRDVAEILVQVGTPAIHLAGKPAPATGLEGKFSTAYCAALGLTGHGATAADFDDAKVADPALQALVRRTRLIEEADRDVRSARIEIRFVDGGTLDSATDMALGNPGNPMSWADMRVKFDALVAPVLGERDCAELFDLLRHFDTGAAKAFVRLVGRG